MIPIKDKRFLEYLSYMIEDYQHANIEELDGLKYMQQTKTLTIMSVGVLHKIIKFREMHIDFIKRHQDKKSFKTVNKEHAYMKRFIERYFDIEDMGSTREHISCSIIRKDSLA